MSTYNGDKFLCELLDSLLSQSYKNYEIRIRDDGSTDKTRDILNEYSSKHQNIILHYGSNIGVAGSFFDLLENAGEDCTYFAFCDQDDIWLKDKVSYAVELLDNREADRPLLYFSRYEYVSSELRHIKYSHIPRKIGFGNAVVHNIVAGFASVINKKTRALILEKKPEVSMHDWWVYLVVSAFGDIVFDRRVSIRYRLHDANVVGAEPSFFYDYGRKFKRLFSDKKTGALALSHQAAEFFRLYAGEMKASDEEILKKILSGKSSLRERIGLALSCKIWRQKPVDGLIQRILFLFNRY